MPSEIGRLLNFFVRSHARRGVFTTFFDMVLRGGGVWRTALVFVRRDDDGKGRQAPSDRPSGWRSPRRDSSGGRRTWVWAVRRAMSARHRGHRRHRQQHGAHAAGVAGALWIVRADEPATGHRIHETPNLIRNDSVERQRSPSPEPCPPNRGKPLRRRGTPSNTCRATCELPRFGRAYTRCR